MKAILNYLTFSISIAFISWIVGMIITALVQKTNFYNNRLSNINFIKSELVNKMIGIGIIKWMVKNTFFKFFNQKLTIKGKLSKSDLNNLRADMTKSEVDHLFAFLFVLLVILFILFKGKLVLAAIILLVNVCMNLYPSLLQQQNKRRIDRLLQS